MGMESNPAASFCTAMSEAEFAELATGLVTDEAPRLFALLEEVGDREDGWIVAWGMAFAEHAHLVGVNGLANHLLLDSAEQARQLLGRRAKIRLIWVPPAPAT